MVATSCWRSGWSHPRWPWLCVLEQKCVRLRPPAPGLLGLREVFPGCRTWGLDSHPVHQPPLILFQQCSSLATPTVASLWSPMIPRSLVLSFPPAFLTITPGPKNPIPRATPHPHCSHKNLPSPHSAGQPFPPGQVLGQPTDPAMFLPSCQRAAASLHQDTAVR